MVKLANRKLKYNPEQFKTLFTKGKSVTQIMKLTGASYPWVHASLQRLGLIPQAHHRPQTGALVKTASGVQRTGPMRTTVTKMPASFDVSEFTAAVARAVAGQIYGDATVTPQPMSRTEAFERINSGIKDGMKRFGFHS